MEDINVQIRKDMRRGTAYALVVPPLFAAPLCILLYLLGADINPIKDLWYVGILIGSIWMARKDGITLNGIGLARKGCCKSLTLATIWETATFLMIGVPTFYLLTGRLPALMPLSSGMTYAAVHFALVGLAEETWFRGLVMRRLLDHGMDGVVAVVWNATLFILIHVPASVPMLLESPALFPPYLLSMSSLFLWSAGFAVIALRTSNIVGPIVLHGVDDFVSKILYPLSI